MNEANEKEGRNVLGLVNEKEKVKDENSSRIRKEMWGRLRKRRQRTNSIMKGKV